MIFLYIAATLASIYLIAITTVFLFQEKFLFRATREMNKTPKDMGWTFQETLLDVQGHKTHLWHIPATQETRRTILFSHGNAGNISDRLRSISIFRDMGYNVIAYDYGGYGKSSGSPSEKRCCQDIRAVWDYAISELNYNPEHIILHGRSLGAGPTAYLATQINAGIVILESTFTTIPDVTRRHYPLLPKWTLSRNQFNTLERISKITTPVLVVHGKKDTLIPYAHGKKLYENANQPKGFLDIDGEHHEGFWMSGKDYTDGLKEFIDQHITA